MTQGVQVSTDRWSKCPNCGKFTLHESGDISLAADLSCVEVWFVVKCKCGFTKRLSGEIPFQGDGVQ